MIRFSFSVFLCFLLAAAGSPVTRSGVDQDNRPIYAERLHANGIHKFGRVDTWLYRGSQPDEDGYASLRALGIRTVLSLREERDDRPLLSAYGLKGIHIPMNPARPPTASEQRRFLSLLADTALHPIFIHCVRGRDRTGVMIGSYRVLIQGWKPNEAIGEMRYFEHSRRDYPALERYIRTLKPGAAQ